MSNVDHPLSVRSCNLGDLRTSQTFGKFIKALHLHLDDLRVEYEESEASEFNRGKVQAVKELINLLAEQHLK